MKIIRFTIVICLMIIATACSNSNNGNQSAPSPSESTVSPSPKTESGQSETSKEVKISKEKYEQVNNGMTYEEVIEIVGGEGEVITETGEKGTELYGISVMYEGEGGIGASANFVFIGNKLQTKSQYGLE